MKTMYTRTVIREIRQSFGRFAAIIAIVALGVGFLMGLLSCTPDMKATADAYYKDYAMSDFDIKCTMGLTDEDVEALSALPETDQIMPAYVTDILMTTGEGELLTGRLYGLDLDNQSVNKLTLQKGRMPASASECVIETPNTYMSQLTIGDTLTLSSEKENLKDTYARDTFTIVGIVDSPYYFANSKEPASAGNGRAGAILYTDSSAYNLEAYTDIFLTLKTSESAFSDEYKALIEKTTDSIEEIAKERSQARYDEIYTQAREKLDDAKKELKQEKKRAEKQLGKTEKKLEKNEKKLSQSADDLDTAKKDLDTAKKQLQSGKDQLAAGKSQLSQAQAQLDASKKELDASKAAVEQAKAAQAAGAELSQETLAQIKAYDEGLAAWKKESARLSSQKKKLAQTEKELASSEKKLNAAEKEITANEKKLETAEKKLEKGREKYEDAAIAADAEFSIAGRKLSQQEDKLKDIKKPKWYVLDRNSNLSYARYKVDVDKVAAVATVFPVFFFLVAALVSLTTMTRMVEEERIQIGTLKALGYRRSKIMSKYLIYCGAATLLGCIAGLAAGFYLLPSVIYKAYAAQYALPDLTLQFHSPYAALSCGLEILCTLGATWLACRRTLREKPATLMVPRAPKAGKRIFLERLGFLWNRLSFSHKATARNIFRYKKHLFMTVIGIAGCTALMVAGFGLRDSISEIVKTQYSEIMKYDMKIELSEDKTDSVLDDFLSGKKKARICNLSGDIQGTKTQEKVSASLYVPQYNQQFTDFVTLRDAKSQKSIAFGDQSVIMSQKAAELLELSPGDRFTFTNSDDETAEFTLTGITENYVGSVLYVGKALYTDAFGEPAYNGYLLDSGITGLNAQDETARNLQDSDYVASVEFTSQARESYETMLSSINLIVYVLILCAGALAVVVLYNLTNININERGRELATLRVLGYHHGEVARYIFREISILSVLGALAGLVAGKALHYYVIIIAETSDMMMGRDISLSSYLLAAGFTLAFSFLVDFLMTFKLRRIQMVESMKAVD
ncbi:FtsX-like permease family protein [bacterium 210820-DFI.6.37]|nr:FtsX-like permease family protein [bacterium 210820-DFI.6.37]